MIKFICDKCDQEKDPKSCFVFLDSSIQNVLCRECFENESEKEVDIFKREDVIKDQLGRDKINETYVIVIDPDQKIIENINLMIHHKTLFLKDVPCHDILKARVILMGGWFFPDIDGSRGIPSIRVPMRLK